MVSIKETGPLPKNMPRSSKECKQEIKDWFDKHDHIKTIVDVGVGEGTYRKLLGDKYEWIGVEIWKPYVKKYHLKKLYPTLYVSNFFDVMDKLEGDCIIFGDVLEHMTKSEAKMAINWANAHFPYVVISTPVEMEQGPYDGNPYEEHKSVWTMEEINSMIPGNFEIRGISWNIALFIK